MFNKQPSQPSTSLTAYTTTHDVVASSSMKRKAGDTVDLSSTESSPKRRFVRLPSPLLHHQHHLSQASSTAPSHPTVSPTNVSTNASTSITSFLDARFAEQRQHQSAPSSPSNSQSAYAWPTSVGKRPPRDMKRLDKSLWYTITRIARWGDTPALFLQSTAKDNTQQSKPPGFFKPPKNMYDHRFSVGDAIKLVQVGYSNSRNKVATHIVVKKKASASQSTAVIPQHNNPQVPSVASLPLKLPTTTRASTVCNTGTNAQYNTNTNAQYNTTTNAQYITNDTDTTTLYNHNAGGASTAKRGVDVVPASFDQQYEEQSIINRSLLWQLRKQQATMAAKSEQQQLHTLALLQAQLLLAQHQQQQQMIQQASQAILFPNAVPASATPPMPESASVSQMVARLHAASQQQQQQQQQTLPKYGLDLRLAQGLLAERLGQNVGGMFMKPPFPPM